MLDISNIDPRIDEYLERVFRISKSYSTKRSYKGALNKFQRFLSRENTDLPNLLKDLNEKKKDPIDTLDGFYTYLSKENASKSTIAGYLCVTKDFLNFHGMHIYNGDVNQILN
ncbi:MAG: site-specific integrase [Crenarchaeota archaeon]|nr:site-specific integrase [Thermoproteota archaeon]MDA1124497.1 site-specific integrase [Thermoproteota archaeon]